MDNDLVHQAFERTTTAAAGQPGSALMAEIETLFRASVLHHNSFGEAAFVNGGLPIHSPWTFQGAQSTNQDGSFNPVEASAGRSPGAPAAPHIDNAPPRVIEDPRSRTPGDPAPPRIGDAPPRIGDAPPRIGDALDYKVYPTYAPEMGGTGLPERDWKFAAEELNKHERPEPPLNMTDEEREAAEHAAELARRILKPHSSAERNQSRHELKEMFSDLTDAERDRFIDAINANLKEEGFRMAFVPKNGQVTLGGLDRKSGKYVAGPVVFGYRVPL